MTNFVTGFLFIIIFVPIWSLIFGTVSVLPFDLEIPTQLVSNVLHSSFSIIPLIEAPYNAFLNLVSFQFTLWLLYCVVVVIRLIRG